MDISIIGLRVKHRREHVGLTQGRLAKLADLSRQTILKLENGTIKDLSFQRVMAILTVLGLDFEEPTLAAREKKRGLWMAAKNASVSYRGELTSEMLCNVLVTGNVPPAYAAHVSHFLDETPTNLVVMSVEETAAKEHLPITAVWRNLAVLAKNYSGNDNRRQLWM
jgi:transcriptional regulator with XRE-family HTH domain